MDYLAVDWVNFSGVGKAIIVLSYNGGEQKMFFLVSTLLFESLEQTAHLFKKVWNNFYVM